MTHCHNQTSLGFCSFGPARLVKWLMCIGRNANSMKIESNSTNIALLDIPEFIAETGILQGLCTLTDIREFKN